MDKRVLGGLVAVALVAGLAYWLMSPGSGGDDTGSGGSTAATATPMAGGGAGATALDPREAALAGTVTAEKDGVPIAGAVVRLTPVDDDIDDLALAARTGDDGRFSLAGIAPGSYAVAAAAPGFVPAVGTRIDLAPDSSETVALELAAGGNQVTGSVSDVSGGPIADAVVTFVPRHGVLSSEPADGFATMSGADGSFSLSVPDGLYAVAARHSDYVPASRTIELRGGAREVTLTMTPAGAIEGVVIAAETGKPVPHALIGYGVERVITLPGGGVLGGGGSRGVSAAGSDGRFRISGLSSGAVRLSARGGGGATADDTIVQLAIGETVTGIELVVDTARSIRGVVVDRATGTPAAGVTVMASRGADRPIEATGPTGADGVFTIEDLAPGSYRLTADGGAYVTGGLGTPVTLGETDLTGVTLKVTRGYQVRGRVEPPGAAEVSLSLADERSLSRGLLRLASVRTGADGRFDLGPLPPGDHAVRATGADGSTGATDVKVVASDVNGVVIELSAGASIAGTVVDAKGAPVTGATVMMKPKTPGRRVTMLVNGRDVAARQSPTHAGGSFVIRGLDAGDYQLTVVDDQHQTLAWAGGKTGPRSVTLTEGEQKTGVTLRVEAADEVIRGVVRTPDGSPAPDTWVTATPSGGLFGAGGPPEPTEGGDVSHSTMMVIASGDGEDGFGGRPPVLTDGDGRFEIRGLKKGAYDLVGQGLRGGARGFLRGVDTGADVVLPLAELTAIEGTVTRDGTPVEQFHVELRGPSMRAKTVRSPDGRFTLRLVDPGEHTIRVSSPAGSAESVVQVTAGETATVAIALERLVAVRGTVVDADGAPVAGSMVITAPDRGDGSMEISISSAGEMPPTTGEDGAFEVRVKPGKYRLLVLGADSPMPIAMEPIDVGDADVELGTITASDPSAGPPEPPHDPAGSD